MKKDDKDIKIKLEFTIPNESPKKEEIIRKFKELMNILQEKEEER